MTMVIAYAWQDKVVMMADSRSSRTDKNGNVIEFEDENEKIMPVRNRFSIGHAGLRKAYLGNGEYLEMGDVTNHCLKINESTLSKLNSKQLLEGIVTTWNRTLSEKLHRNPFSLENRYCFALGSFVENETGELEPKIHTYQSHFNEFQFGGRKAVIGDDAVYAIIKPYYEEDTDNWTLEETIEFYKKGFVEVMNQVETVGGPIDIFVLDTNPEKSYWLGRKPNR
ncbi:hypothetical protein L1N85_17070 [Paenibacillus alkaliterrae]|uniref:hypothetical protein n=1 Tax=Paenibacillus alkaliterrae TaxID=320909 RepID=UPI001F256640|nr:hypothetical protein [Paenibacillus alkaliterrae]MCF2940119.1 hypothetical protein [Paenibacillus alkaliterrae]